MQISPKVFRKGWLRRSNGAFAALLTLSIALAGVVAATTPAVASPNGLLAPYETLNVNQSVTSPNGGFVLIMQGDGNLVAYLDGAVYGPGVPIWASGTSGHPGNIAVMQGDGNLVIYGPTCTFVNHSCWNSGTGGSNGAYAQLQNDGNYVIYLGAPVSSDAKWSSRTYGSTVSNAAGSYCSAWSNVFGSINVCLQSTVWHNGVHAGVLSPTALAKPFCTTSGNTTLLGRSCGRVSSGSYILSGGLNEDWVNQLIISDPPLASYATYYCVYLRIDTDQYGHMSAQPVQGGTMHLYTGSQQCSGQ